MPIATLSIDLEARLANLEAGFDKAARLAEKNAEQTRAAWARVGSGIASAVGALAGFVAVDRLVESFKQAVDGLDKLNDVADATGASIENISGLEDVIRRTGGSIETVETTLIKFNAVLSEAKPDSPMAQALARIGLQAEELRKMDPAEALLTTANALSGYADDGDKARLVQELFGKSVREIAPFLKDLGEAGQLNAKATAAQAAEAEKFNKVLADWNTTVSLAWRSIAVNLLPVLTELAQSLRDATQAYGSFWEAAIDQGLNVDPFKSLNENLTETVTAIAAVKKEMAKTEGMRGGWFMGDEAIDSDLKRLREQLRLLEAREQVLRKKQLREGGGRGLVTPLSAGDEERPSVGTLPNAPGKPGRADRARAEQISEAQRALAQYVAELQKELDKGQELTDQQRALNQLRSLGSLGQVPEVRELVLGMSQQVTLLKQDEAIRRDITAEMERQLALQRSLDDAIDQFSGRSADALKAQQTARLEARLNAGESFSPEELDRIVKGIGGIKDEMKPQLDQMDEMLKQFGRNAQDALGDTILRSLKGDFDSIEQLWGNLLANMVAQALAARVGKELFGDLFSGGDLGGGVGSLLKLGASYFGIPGFAAGGDHGGGWRVVGERGPELEATGAARIFNAAQTAQILGGGGGAGGGRSVSVHYAPTIQIDGRADRAQAMQDAQAVMRQGQKEMLNMLKAKGVV